ncbi:Hsp20 family protein [Spirosoma humi]
MRCLLALVSVTRSCDQQQIQARYENGILHIELPKQEEAKSKAPIQIQIN